MWVATFGFVGKETVNFLGCSVVGTDNETVVVHVQDEVLALLRERERKKNDIRQRKRNSNLPKSKIEVLEGSLLVGFLLPRPGMQIALASTQHTACKACSAAVLAYHNSQSDQRNISTVEKEEKKEENVKRVSHKILEAGLPSYPSAYC